jgi:hypothetical protein
MLPCRMSFGGNMKNDHRLSWLLVGLAAILLTACTSSTPTPEASSPTQVPQPTDLPAVSTEEPAQLVFGPGTFSLDLPVGWEIYGPLEVTNDPDRPYEVYQLGEDPSTSGGPGMSIVAIDRTDRWTPEDFVLAQCSTCPNNGFESVTIDGIPALRTEIGGGGVPIMITWYFVEHRGNFIAFTIHDPETLLPLEDVIQSIRFE